jgi:pimeloyl-ACP methyl ester carboxylesterase
MRHISRLGLCLLLILGMIALAPAQTTASSQHRRDTTEQILRRLGGRPCPDSQFTCVALAVPLDHFNAADRRTIDVVFAVLPAAGERKGMFVTATGGPGTSGLAAKDSYTAAFDPSIRKRFDIVFFDQRGVAASGGLTCPQAAASYYQAGGRAETRKQEDALKQAARTFAGACVSEMGTPDILPYLGTAQAVEDLEAFRRVMQDDRFWLYGESYGTQYAQTYAAAHGKHLAGLMLDGTVDLTLDGITYYDQQTRAFNDTLVATLEACDDDQGCAADTGAQAVAAYDKLAARLKRGPIPYTFPLPSGGTERRAFTFAYLEIVAVGQMYNEGDRMLFQRALAAAAGRDDLVPLARLLYSTLGLDPQSLVAIPDPSWSDAIFYSVECQDYAYFSGRPSQRAEQYIRAGDAVDARIPRLNSLFYGDLPCVYWPDASADLTRPAPLIAKGIPTLVLGAIADPATPVGNGISVYQHLDNGYLITQRGGPHVIFGRGNACPDDIVTAFLVKDRVPSKRRTECEGVVADAYVPLAPADAAAFETALEAFESAESELNYLPEYYYWDGAAPTSVGCPQGGGRLAFEPSGGLTAFTLDRCAFSRGWAMTGTGRYNAQKDRFVLDVTVGGVAYRYVREGADAKVTTGGRTLERSVAQRLPAASVKR